MDTAISLYNLFKTDKRKERFDIILEPMQALIQLSLMAFCPYGSKLSISNNLLYIQQPTWVQGLIRSFNHDKRDDLFFLFNSILRFNKFYAFLKKSDLEDDRMLFDLLIRLGKRGIDNILQTYANVDQPSLLHTLQMYRTLLENPELIVEKKERVKEHGKSKNEANDSSKANDSSSSKAHDSSSKANANDSSKQRDNNSMNNKNMNDNSMNDNSMNNKNINDVFIKIREIYTDNDRIVIANTLYLLEKRPDFYDTYITGLNAILEPINTQIKKWINDNIVY
jgi:hypothetical protein